MWRVHRPMISLLSHWTGPFLFQRVSHLFVCRRKVPIPINTPTKRQRSWDGMVTMVRSPILYWFIDNVASHVTVIFFLKPVVAGSLICCTPAGSYYYSVPLQQGRVRMASNAECKIKDGLSKYVTDTTTCVHSNKRFTCQVSKWLSKFLHLFTRVHFKQHRVTSVVQ